MGKFIEPVVDAIYSLLNSGMATALDAIETEYADSKTLDDIKKVWKGGIPTPGAEFPAQVIWPEETCDAGEYSNGSEWWEQRVIVWTVIVGDDPEDVHEKLWRYMRATYSVLMADNHLSVSGTKTVDICELAGFRHDTPWAFAEDDPMIGIGGVIIKIHNEETA